MDTNCKFCDAPTIIRVISGAFDNLKSTPRECSQSCEGSKAEWERICAEADKSNKEDIWSGIT